MKKLRILFRYLDYRLRASNAHDIHSPFVYDLLTNVILSNKKFYAYEKIESLRAKMLLSSEEILVTDFGTGTDNNSQRKLGLYYITKNFVKSKKYGQLLFRLVNKFQPKNLLELGTSIGITTLYQAMPDSNSKMITLEGCPGTAAKAREHFELFKQKNIELITGEFSKTLPVALQKTSSLDYVFFDGNHRKAPTLEYFESCLEKSHEHSVFIFDDIHWSKEMEECWKEIKNHPKVSVTIDLFFIGIVFFRTSQAKENFVLRF